MSDVLQLADVKNQRKEQRILSEARGVYAKRVLDNIGEVIARATALQDAGLGANILKGLDTQIELSLELIRREEGRKVTL